MKSSDELKMAQPTKSDMEDKASRASRCSQASRVSSHLSKDIADSIAGKLSDRLKELIEEELRARSRHLHSRSSHSSSSASSDNCSASRQSGVSGNPRHNASRQSRISQRLMDSASRHRSESKGHQDNASRQSRESLRQRNITSRQRSESKRQQDITSRQSGESKRHQDDASRQSRESKRHQDNASRESRESKRHQDIRSSQSRESKRHQDNASRQHRENKRHQDNASRQRGESRRHRPKASRSHTQHRPSRRRSMNEINRCRSLTERLSVSASQAKQIVQKENELNDKMLKAMKRKPGICPNPCCRIRGKCFCEKFRSQSVVIAGRNGPVIPSVTSGAADYRNSPMVRQVDPDQKWLSFQEIGEHNRKKRAADRKNWFREWYRTHGESLSRCQSDIDTTRKRNKKKGSHDVTESESVSSSLGMFVRSIWDKNSGQAGKDTDLTTYGRAFVPAWPKDLDAPIPRHPHTLVQQNQGEVVRKKEPGGKQKNSKSSFYVRPGSGPPGSIELVVRNSATPGEPGEPRKVDVRIFRTRPMAEYTLRPDGKCPPMRKLQVPGLEKVRVGTPFGGFPNGGLKRKKGSSSARKFPHIYPNTEK